MTLPPRTPAEWLRFTADLAARHEFTTITKSGAFLQMALIDCLRAGAEEDADPLDMLADFLTLLPRFQNALVQANHQGSICRRCAARYASMLFDEIISDAGELAARQSSERKH